MRSKMILSESSASEYPTIVDIRKISENKDQIVYQAVKIQTKKIKIEDSDIRADMSQLTASLLWDVSPMLALTGTHEDIFCDVTYFSTMVYSRLASPDPYIGYCYKITSVKGGLISKSDSQISVTKIVLGYVEHGQYWVNRAGTGGVTTLSNLAKYTITYPVIGTTYSTSGPTQNYYYCIEDEISGIQSRTTIYLKRLNSTFTANSYVEFVEGTAY